MHVDKLNVQLRQETKWGELDVFFKTNSQYYKQIDNDDIVFIVGTDGTDFIANLFLNDLTETLTNNRIQSESIWNHIKYNRQGPEPWFDDHIIWDNPGHADSKQYTLLPESFNILKTLNLPEILDYRIDTNLKDFYSSNKTLNGTRYFITKFLPVIPYFYYKNFEKVKIILIEIDDMNLSVYADFFRALRISHGIGNSAILSDREDRTTFEAWAEEHELYTVLDRFTELKKVVGTSEYTNGIFLNAMINNQWTVVNQIEQNLHCLYHLNTIEPMYVDINHNLSSKHNGGMMDFPVFADQLYKISYRKLFFEQNKTEILQLKDLFNVTYDTNYYKAEIKKYHVANIELKYQIQEKLVIALDTLTNELQLHPSAQLVSWIYCDRCGSRNV